MKPAPGELAPLIIVGDVLVDGTGANAILSPTVTIRGDRIASIHARADGETIPDNARVIDASGCTLLPGLIDTHSHLAIGRPLSRFSPEYPQIEPPPDVGQYLEGISRAQSALLGGVTTIRDCGGPGLMNVRLRDARNGGLWVGPRILACGNPLTTTAGHAYWMGGRVDSAEGLRHAVRLLAEHGVDFVKVMVTGGMGTPGSNPYATQFTLEELRPAVEDAHRLGLRVAAHVLCTEGVTVAATAGVDTIEHGWTITGRRQDFHPRVIDPVRRSGAIASVTAHESLRSLLPSRPSGGDASEIRRRLSPHRALRDAGVPMVVHSDSGAGETTFDAFGESVEVFAVGMEVDATLAVQAATGAAAVALGIGEDYGTLEAGKIADITIVEGDVRSDLGALRRVRDVLIGGAEVVSGRRLLTSPPIRT